MRLFDISGDSGARGPFKHSANCVLTLHRDGLFGGALAADRTIAQLHGARVTFVYDFVHWTNVLKGLRWHMVAAAVMQELSTY